MAERNTGAGREDGREPVDEDAAWAAIVAGYGEEPADPDLSLDDDEERQPQDTAAGRDDRNDGDDRDDGDSRDSRDEADGPSGPGAPGSSGVPSRPLGSSVTGYMAGVGPRDWATPEPAEGDADEGHFVPPEPPPLPSADTTAKFAWLAVLGGPLLLLLTVLLQWEMTWLIATLGIGGFLGGFGTLVARMRDDDEEDDDPGRGAVV
ncbi:hypothetical protein ACFYYR_22520 [Streptomyces sp. NPDC001922]|uniref:hypothetical protein n=1 Tax=Streptomyces sp. NPDC001922 TaxID=3364624 RepID=UPI003683E8F5